MVFTIWHNSSRARSRGAFVMRPTIPGICSTWGRRPEPALADFGICQGRASGTAAKVNLLVSIHTGQLGASRSAGSRLLLKLCKDAVHDSGGEYDLAIRNWER